MEHIEGLEVRNVEMRWENNELEQWNNPMEFKPSTVNNIHFSNFNSAVYSNRNQVNNVGYASIGKKVHTGESSK